MGACEFLFERWSDFQLAIVLDGGDEAGKKCRWLRGWER